MSVFLTHIQMIFQREKHWNWGPLAPHMRAPFCEGRCLFSPQGRSGLLRASAFTDALPPNPGVAP